MRLSLPQILWSEFASWKNDVRIFRAAYVSLLIGLATAISTFFSVADWEDRASHEQFSKAAADQALGLQNGLNEYLSKLISLRAFFSASTDGVGRSEFAIFTDALIEGPKAILSFSWLPRILQEDRPRHEREGQRDGLPDYEIRTVNTLGELVTAPRADEYFPVYFSNEMLRGRGYGINIKDGGVRQAPLDRAGEGDILAASGNFRMQSGTGDRNGFFAVLPVYRRNSSRATLLERRGNLIGFVQAVFQFDALIDAIMTDVHAPMTIAIFEADAAPGSMPVHVRNRDTGNPGVDIVSAYAADAGWTGDLKAGDMHWRVVFLPAYASSTLVRHNRAWLVFCALLLLATLATVYLRNSIREMQRLKLANDDASTLARMDPLTGLPNRRAFSEHLGRALAGVGRGHAPFAIHFIDLDEFKDINDTQGHAAGDELLRKVATRLVREVRGNDLVARFGGDEFAVLQTDVKDPLMAGALAGKLIRSLGADYDVNGVRLRVGASIGVALQPTESLDAKAMMMQADLALYRAKADGRNRFRLHDATLDQQVQLRVNLADELRTAIERGELELYYQTQVVMRTKRIVGLEALLRWNHPTRGLIMPSIFVPLAEQMGLIGVLGQWVLRQACRQLHEWERQGLAVPRLAVNVSGAQLRRPEEFEAEVAKAFAFYGVRRHAIEFELTETVLMDVSQKQADAITRLQALGATIAIDDFGTGYSSLRYLTTYPIQRLKIAQDLIAKISSDSRNAVVVRSTIRLAEDLGIAVIAEGVERAEQMRILLDAGCEYAQGYYFNRPMAATDVALLLARLDSAIPGDAQSSATAA